MVRMLDLSGWVPRWAEQPSEMEALVQSESGMVLVMSDTIRPQFPFVDRFESDILLTETVHVTAAQRFHAPVTLRPQVFLVPETVLVEPEMLAHGIALPLVALCCQSDGPLADWGRRLKPAAGGLVGPPPAGPADHARRPQGVVPWPRRRRAK